MTQTSRHLDSPDDQRNPETGSDAARLLEESLASVRTALSGIRFGSVTLTIHDGRVVQVDVTEKKRLRPN